MTKKLLNPWTCLIGFFIGMLNFSANAVFPELTLSLDEIQHYLGGRYKKALESYLCYNMNRFTLDPTMKRTTSEPNMQHHFVENRVLETLTQQLASLLDCDKKTRSSKSQMQIIQESIQIPEGASMCQLKAINAGGLYNIIPLLDHEKQSNPVLQEIIDDPRMRQIITDPLSWEVINDPLNQGTINDFMNRLNQKGLQDEKNAVAEWRQTASSKTLDQFMQNNKTFATTIQTFNKLKRVELLVALMHILSPLTRSEEMVLQGENDAYWEGSSIMAPSQTIGCGFEPTPKMNEGRILHYLRNPSVNSQMSIETQQTPPFMRRRTSTMPSKVKTLSLQPTKTPTKDKNSAFLHGAIRSLFLQYIYTVFQVTEDEIHWVESLSGISIPVIPFFRSYEIFLRWCNKIEHAPVKIEYKMLGATESATPLYCTTTTNQTATPYYPLEIIYEKEYFPYGKVTHTNPYLVMSMYSAFLQPTDSPLSLEQFCDQQLALITPYLTEKRKFEEAVLAIAAVHFQFPQSGNFSKKKIPPQIINEEKVCQTPDGYSSAKNFGEKYHIGTTDVVKRVKNVQNTQSNSQGKLKEIIALAPGERCFLNTLHVNCWCPQLEF